MRETSIDFFYPAQRILQFIDNQNITKYEFHKKIGVSNGFLDKAKEIRTDNLRKILDNYPIINPDWLLTGKGEMLRGTPAPAVAVADPCADRVAEVKEQYTAIIKGNERLIVLLTSQVEEYKEQITEYKASKILADKQIAALVESLKNIEEADEIVADFRAVFRRPSLT